jgi:hypothetical protein
MEYDKVYSTRRNVIVKAERIQTHLFAMGIVAGGIWLSPVDFACAQDEGRLTSRADAPVEGGVEVMTRGPIHEAFAQPVDPGEVSRVAVPKKPPEAIEEVPPIMTASASIPGRRSAAIAVTPTIHCGRTMAGTTEAVIQIGQERSPIDMPTIANTPINTRPMISDRCNDSRPNQAGVRGIGSLPTWPTRCKIGVDEPSPRFLLPP